MANAAAFIQESIWRDEHWRQLSRSSQALYMQLLSQKELDCAGVLPLQPNKWAKGCSELTVEEVLADLEELQRERFVFFDYDSDEAFIRTYVRHSNVVKIPNMRKSARRAALLVGSGRIKNLLAVELRATEHPDFVALADEISPFNPSPNGSPNGSKTAVTEPLPEPLPEPTGVGKGLGTGVTNRSNQVGERRPQCPSHEENFDGPCRKCKLRREWDELHAGDEAARAKADELDERRRQRQARADAIADCEACDGDGFVEIGEGLARRCERHA
jgi:hypothetical protein